MNKGNNLFLGLEEDLIYIFSERLKKIRTSAKLTQQQFANEIGISVAALSYYETGKRVPDIIFLKKISEYFNIPVDYFLGFTNSIKKENENISNKLRLSDEAIEKIQIFIDNNDEGNYYEYSDVLNRLLENDDFYSVLNFLTWSGYECCTYMPDEEYILFIAMKKMMNVIKDTINTSSYLKERIVEAIIPDQIERERYYKWLLEQSDKNSEELQMKYKEHRDTLIESVNAKFAEYNESISLRTEALNHLKENEKNAEHNPTQE